MVNAIQQQAPGANIVTEDVFDGEGEFLDQLLTVTNQLVNSNQLPDAINLSAFATDANDPRVQAIRANFENLADRGVRIATVAGKVLDADGNVADRNATMPGDQIVQNALAPNHPNVFRVDASNENTGLGNAFFQGPTTSMATARFLGNLANTSQQQSVTGTPVTAGGQPAAANNPFQAIMSFFLNALVQLLQ